MAKNAIRLACRLRYCATLEPFEGPWRTESRYLHCDALTLAFEQEIIAAIRGQPLSGLFNHGSRPKQFLAVVRRLAIELLGFGTDIEPPFPPNIAPGQRRSNIAYWNAERLDLRELRRFNKGLAECLGDPTCVRVGRQIGETADVKTTARFNAELSTHLSEPNIALLDRLKCLKPDSLQRLEEFALACNDPSAQWLLGHLRCQQDVKLVPRAPFISSEQRACVIRSRRFMLTKAPTDEFPEEF